MMMVIIIIIIISNSGKKKYKALWVVRATGSSIPAIRAASPPKSYKHKFPAEIFTNHRSKTYHHGQNLTKLTQKIDLLFFFFLPLFFFGFMDRFWRAVEETWFLSLWHRKFHYLHLEREREGERGGLQMIKNELPVCLQSFQDLKAMEASSMAIPLYLTSWSAPVNRFSSTLHRQPLWDISQWFEVAFNKGLNKVACLILGVSIWNIHYKWLDHPCPWSPINYLWMEGDDWWIVLQPKKNWNQMKQETMTIRSWKLLWS